MRKWRLAGGGARDGKTEVIERGKKKGIEKKRVNRSVKKVDGQEEPERRKEVRGIKRGKREMGNRQ